jgi:hypothetical protein
MLRFLFLVIEELRIAETGLVVVIAAGIPASLSVIIKI